MGQKCFGPKQAHPFYVFDKPNANEPRWDGQTSHGVRVFGIFWFDVHEPKARVFTEADVVEVERHNFLEPISWVYP